MYTISFVRDAIPKRYCSLLRIELMMSDCDQESSIKLPSSDGNPSRIKFTCLMHHYVPNKVFGGSIEVLFNRIDHIVANPLTKSTSHSKVGFGSSGYGRMKFRYQPSYLF